ncbi:SDR family NAD(P)-dependent oxidoreductase [Cryptosporangium aurantiacum]|uniref:NAD(P)-dependent dehydrogenase, short-chain alcohol dehydrogenase family n=1 Tax=Cryptosporangium aurantiacum TaxID=134849 RepID=A0A1M7RG43_9ACTN|nr:SDR family oxidoreductase [Cryptosporangium aurantiacum]SHN45267.1 NAD(P)-dependent dehydrogenase, short-chain alcohol dehydrogenase family [Cryptosporangium aurantiacum]
MLLNGKTAIVTGSGSGVGRAIALRFASEGAQVVCADLRLDWAKETVRQAESAGGTAVAVECDVADEPSVAHVVDGVPDRLDIIVNNVGIATPRPGLKLEEHTGEDFERLVAVNFRGVFHGTKHGIRRFKEQGSGGVILNTGSVAGLVGWGGSVYGATKGAVHQLTRAAAIEGAPFKIRANALAPAGMPYTNFAAGFGLSGDVDALARQVGAQHPLGDPITAEDCAEAAVYLCSDRAANVTGVLLPIDGGYVAK